MRIGFSFGGCLNDILSGKVDYDDVLLIIARTRMATIDIVDSVVNAYIWDGRIVAPTLDDKENATQIGRRLYREGKLHQPRLFDMYPQPVLDDRDIWMDLAPTINSDNEAVVKAWKNYQMVLRLAEEEKPAMPMHLPKKRSTNLPIKPIDDNF